MNKRMRPKIYLACFPLQSGFMAGDVHGCALAEDGTGLTGHISSHTKWAKHDLGLTSNWKHEIYGEHYPKGYELIWIDNPATDERWQAALVLNKAKYEKERENKCPQEL